MSDPDPHGLNTRQRLFVQKLSGGMAAGRAYEAAGYVATGGQADTLASKLSRNVKVVAALAAERARAQAAADMTKDEAIRILVETVRSKPSEAHMENPLCELKMTAMGPLAVFQDKGACLEKLARWLGWNEPEKHEVELEVVIGGKKEE